MFFVLILISFSLIFWLLNRVTLAGAVFCSTSQDYHRRYEILGWRVILYLNIVRLIHKREQRLIALPIVHLVRIATYELLNRIVEIALN